MKRLVLVGGNTAWDCKRAYTEPTLSVPILTALLKDEFDLLVIDGNVKNISKEDMLTAIRKTEAEMVLITALSVEWHTCYHEMTRIAKEALASCKVLMGGYPAVSGDFVLQDANVDYIMLGYAEGRINRIIHLILNDSELIENESGVGFRRNGRICIILIDTYIGDVEEMVQSDYSLADLNPYLSEEKSDNAIVKREGSINSSYGCPYNCVFCATRTISGRKIAFRPAEDVLEEMKYLINTYKIDSIRFLDDNILADKERAKIIFQEMIRRKYGIKF